MKANEKQAIAIDRGSTSLRRGSTAKSLCTDFVSGTCQDACFRGDLPWRCYLCYLPGYMGTYLMSAGGFLF